MTKKPKLELHPIAKVEQYEFGKVVKAWWEIKLPDGKDIIFPSYQDAEIYRQAEGWDD